MISRGSSISLFFVFVSLIVTLKSANSYRPFYPDASSEDERDAFNEREEELFKLLVANQRKALIKNVQPPSVDQPALMGRFIVNQAEWAAVATISTRSDIVSFPIANVKSVSDGPLGNGTGIPYMYLTPLDSTTKDLAQDNRASLLMTLAQGSYCKDNNFDSMDPRCARIMLSGTIHEVKNDTTEYEIAKNAVFGRHPWLATVPPFHHFFFAKLDIVSISVLATFGGANNVTVEDYLNAPIPANH